MNVSSSAILVRPRSPKSGVQRVDCDQTARAKNTRASGPPRTRHSKIGYSKHSLPYACHNPTWITVRPLSSAVRYVLFHSNGRQIRSANSNGEPSSRIDGPGSRGAACLPRHPQSPDSVGQSPSLDRIP